MLVITKLITSASAHYISHASTTKDVAIASGNHLYNTAMTYDALKVKAQHTANDTGKWTCIVETYNGYTVRLLTEKVFFSMNVQEVYEPMKGGN